MNLNTGGWASRALTPLLRIIRGATNATVPVVVISEPVNSETAALVNADVAIVAKGTGATLAQVPDGTVLGGNKRGIYATDWQKVRGDRTYVASGNYSTIGGGWENVASGQDSVIAGGRFNNAGATRAAIAGGEFNVASSQYSFIGGGQSNTAQTSSYATVCGGANNTASGTYSFVGGGQLNTASASNAVVSGGSSNTASATSAAVIGGDSNTANAIVSTVLGGFYGTTRNIEGNCVIPACNAPIAPGAGRTQSALLLLGRQTTDATATVLTSNTFAASTTNQVILPNNSAYSFSVEVIAGRTGGGDTARWTINGAIKRGAGAGTTAMVGTPTVTMTHNDAGAAAWVVNVTADTTNGGISVTVTGAASTTIRWVTKLNTTEMSY